MPRSRRTTSSPTSAPAVPLRPLAPAEAEFGVVVTVTRRDLHRAKETCASVRFFMPDVDADTVVWGDVREHADFDRWDFVLDLPLGGSPHVERWIMDADAAARHFPQFDARGHVKDYVNNGAFFGRRGVLDLDRYLELARFSHANPGVFLTDLGIFNFHALRRGRRRLGAARPA